MREIATASSQAGLTALELLLVLTITAILTAAGIPALQEHGLRKRMAAAVSGLHTDLNLARREAISRNSHVIACPGSPPTGCLEQTAWQQGWLLFDDLNGDRAWQQAEPVIRIGNRLEHITVRSSAGRHSIRFSPAGAAPASNASIVFCDRRGLDAGRKLLISNTGRIRRSELDEQDAARCAA
ncbi:MAG TPA: GspH/FimT family pseudopilin [Xanthomonadales bacterium]|nr:GspH/FimT family pseudopilin [Xanthomonadales bacterium]